jgi:pyridoxine 5-phosphate synthase
MTRLSVNINKIATLRNARGANVPNVVQVALDCETFGAQGITVHPRPDERHIRYADVYALKELLTTEFNIEGNPQEEKFVRLVSEIKPAQVTLVPDALGAITSSAGWDTIKHQAFLTEMCAYFNRLNIRTSIFIDPLPEMAQGAAACGANRVELYTEPYATQYPLNPVAAIRDYINTAAKATECGLGINAGHDLDLNNLAWLKRQIPNLAEVSIGHALISDALYLGLENTIHLYKSRLSA